MIVYKDKTFCPFYIACKQGKECNNKANGQLLSDANDFGLPVALFTDKPKCFKVLDPLVQ